MYTPEAVYSKTGLPTTVIINLIILNKNLEITDHKHFFLTSIVGNLTLCDQN